MISPEKVHQLMVIVKQKMKRPSVRDEKTWPALPAQDMPDDEEVQKQIRAIQQGGCCGPTIPVKP